MHLISTVRCEMGIMHLRSDSTVRGKLKIHCEIYCGIENPHWNLLLWEIENPLWKILCYGKFKIHKLQVRCLGNGKLKIHCAIYRATVIYCAWEIKHAGTVVIFCNKSIVF